MNILIIEDEITDFNLLSAMLVNQMPDSCIMGPLTSIADCRRFFAQNDKQIDLIVSDVQLEDGLSFYALNDARPDTPIIFVTDSDEYALRAFDFNSLSYLLKPVDEETLREAVRKAQQRLITDELRDTFMKMMAQTAGYRERLIVKTYNGEHVLSISEVRYFVSEQKTTYAVMHDASSYNINMSLTQLESELNPRQFMRVNRKYIVPAAEVAGFESGTNGKELLILHGNSQPEITISRDAKKDVHQWLG